MTGDLAGVVRVGPVEGDEPHVLLGHRGAVAAVELDPRGRWIASGGTDGVVRLWPLPSGPPLHTLPGSELVDLLARSTNFRVVAGEAGPDG